MLYMYEGVVIMKKISKGMPGYFGYRKKVTLLAMISGYLLVLLFYFTGIIIFADNKNLLTVAATVSMLPTAKMTIAFLMYPKKGKADQKTYDNIVNEAGKMAVLSDILITPEKKSIEFPYVAVGNNDLVIFCDDVKLDKKYHSDFIKRFLQVDGYTVNIVFFDRIDKFIDRVKVLGTKEDLSSEENIERVNQIAYKIKLMSI